MTAVLLPNAKAQFIDSTGKPLVGGKVYFYIPNTSTLKDTYQDAAQTILNTNPVILDANGQAIIWGVGTYRQVVYDQYGNLIWDQITEDISNGVIGNFTDNVFVSGAGFTPGTTTQLTLAANYGSLDNIWVFFDGVWQGLDQLQSLIGNVLTFVSPIPVGVNKVYVKGGTTVSIGTPNPGTVTDASVAANAGIQSSKLSYQAPPTGSILRTVFSRLTDFLSSFDFNAKADDATDDTTAVQNLINAGGGWLGVNKTYKINGALTLDVSQSYLEGRGCVFDFTGGGTLQVFSSLAFPADISNTTRAAVKGVQFKGPNTGASIGITIGHATYQNNDEITFEHCSWFQFGTNLNFINNAWRVRFVQCISEQPVTYHINAPTTLSNSGEVMQFDHCMFVDAVGDMYMGLGQWIFNACSIGIGATIHGLNSAVINLNGCNVESQPNAGYRMIFLQSNASCVVNGGDFIINNGTIWNLNPILLEADCSIHFFGTNIPFNSAYQKFENDLSKLRTWVAGAGRVTARGITSQSAATLTGTGNNAILAKSLSYLTNGDAELGNTSGWTTSTGGTGVSTFTASTAAKLNGNYGFDMVNVSGGSISASQNIVGNFAGQLCGLYASSNVLSGSGTVATANLVAKDGVGNVLASSSFAITGPLGWNFAACYFIAPPGTTNLTATIAGTSGPSEIYWDEIMVNVM